MRPLFNHSPLRGIVLTAGTMVLIAGLAAPADAATNISFSRKVDSSTGGASFGPGPAPEVTVTADFNRDGRPDIALVDFTDPLGRGPIVLLNRGNRSFAQGPRILLGANGIDNLAVGDVNGDGKADLVGRRNLGLSAVVIMLGNGAGGFSLGRTYPIPSPGAQSQAIVSDVNSDGRLDVVSLNATGITTLLGNGNGTFRTLASQQFCPTFSSISLLPASVAATKVGGKPSLFLLCAVSPSQLLQGAVVVLKGNGDGTFAQSGMGRTGLGPEHVVAADLNKDGVSDAVVADSFNMGITVLPGSGSGLGASAFYSTGLGSGPPSLAVADLNKDGSLDVAVADVVLNRMVIFKGDGTGRLTANSPASFTVTSNPQTPVAVDLDKDGRLDIAVPGAGNVAEGVLTPQLSVLYNTTP